jgi:hypothetical protein
VKGILDFGFWILDFGFAIEHESEGAWHKAAINRKSKIPNKKSKI